jgi:hypothetical protein
MNDSTPDTQSKPSYEPPEMVEIGGVAEHTLGAANLANPDGCDCTKKAAPNMV